MGSTICVRCGATLISHSYCDVCHDVLSFTCSSCSTNTDERIHVNCRSVDTVNNKGIRLEDAHRLMQEPESSQSIMDDYNLNTHYHIQNQLNDEIKYKSINLSTSYWDNVFESIKLVNRYWIKIFNIGINNSYT